ncbi:hypothetical protein JHK85_010618 [Glycine max]|nr:hypothetical protein JHK85_010618 [Glycine max]
MASRKRARTDDIPSSSIPAPQPIIPLEYFLEKVTWSEAQLRLVRPNEVAPLEPAPTQVEPMPAEPRTPMVNPPPSPELSSPISTSNYHLRCIIR